jgi:spore germination protein YaaH
MKKLFYLFLIIINTSFINFAQNEISVHARQKKEFGSLPVQKSLFDVSGKGIIPLKYDKAKLSSTVFGYLPYWEYSGSKGYLQYDLLTHIAAFDFGASTNGTITLPSYWPWTDVINNAHAKGVKIIMCVTNMTGSEIHTIITTASSKQTLFNTIKTVIQNYSLDGVNIDFEGLAAADRGSLINGFMTELTTFIHTNLPDKEVSFAGPAINWSAWNLPGLVAACDYVFIMGYDFYGSWSTETGPSAPLNGSGTTIATVFSSSQYGYAGALPASANKLILGVPYYGNKWLAKSNSAYATVQSFVGSTTYRTEAANGPVYGLKWDASSSTPWYSYQSGSSWMQVWYDTDTSLGLKYNLAKSKNLKGIGMWALGQDGARSEYWDLLRKRFFVDVKDQSAGLPAGFALGQNYPNPFNPTTVINYQIPVSGKVSLKIYDLLGKEVANLVDEEKAAGSYSVEFTGKISSGVYFYTLRAGEFAETKKMTILK